MTLKCGLDTLMARGERLAGRRYRRSGMSPLGVQRCFLVHGFQPFPPGLRRVVGRGELAGALAEPAAAGLVPEQARDRRRGLLAGLRDGQRRGGGGAVGGLRAPRRRPHPPSPGPPPPPPPPP